MCAARMRGGADRRLRGRCAAAGRPAAHGSCCLPPLGVVAGSNGRAPNPRWRPARSPARVARGRCGRAGRGPAPPRRRGGPVPAAPSLSARVQGAPSPGGEATTRPAQAGTRRSTRACPPAPARGGSSRPALSTEPLDSARGGWRDLNRDLRYDKCYFHVAFSISQHCWRRLPLGKKPRRWRDVGLQRSLGPDD